jgi:hypothetical protein
MESISLKAFLAEIDLNIDQDKPVIFSIRFVKAGKNEFDPKRGEVRTVARASKGGIKEQSKATKTNQSGKNGFYNVKQTGVLVLYDHDRKENFTPLIDLITHYNGKKIIR